MELPLFPLHVVLFPGRPLPLHVFEPRYRALLADAMDADRRFGVVAIRSGCEVGAPAQTFSVGTVAEIEQCKRREDGRADILTRGLQRFRILEPMSGSPYLKAQVELLGDDPSGPRPPEDRGMLLRALLLPYLAGLGAPKELLSRLPADPCELAWLAAATVHVEVPERQRLLEMDSPVDRVETMVQMLRREAGIMRHLGAVGSLQPPGPNGAQLN